MLSQLGPFQDDGGVDVGDGVGLKFLLYYLLEELLTIGILIGRVSIRKVGSDVPFCQCT